MGYYDEQGQWQNSPEDYPDGTSGNGGQPGGAPQEGNPTGAALPPPLSFDPSKVPAGIPLEWAEDFWNRNNGDYGRMAEAYGFGGSSQPPTAAGAGGTLWQGGSGRTAYAPFTPPSFDAPTFAPPAPFEYPDFTAPNEETFKADPGYKFRQSEGNRAITNAASADGLARSGGFLKGMAEWNQGLASQEFGNIYDRNLKEWQTGYDRKAQDYERDWRSSLTDYTLKYGAEDDEFKRALSSYGMNFDVHQGEFSNLASLYGMATRTLPQYTPVPSPAY